MAAVRKLAGIPWPPCTIAREHEHPSSGPAGSVINPLPPLSGRFAALRGLTGVLTSPNQVLHAPTATTEMSSRKANCLGRIRNPCSGSISFIGSGNLATIAAGVIVADTFKAFVRSIVGGIFKPPFTLLVRDMGFDDFVKWGLVLADKSDEKKAVVMVFGDALHELLNLSIIGAAAYVFISFVNKIQASRGAHAAKDLKPCEFCLNMVPKEALRCGFCTSMLKEAGKQCAPQPSPAKVTVSARMLTAYTPLGWRRSAL